MLRRTHALITVCALLLMCSPLAAQIPFDSFLDGAQETPPVVTTGIGSATGTLTGGPGSWVFTYSGTFQNLIGTTNNAHIHQAPPGVPGGVVHPLDVWSIGVSSGTFSGDWRFDDGTNPLTDALAGSLVAGGMYFNLHSTFRPGGEIRGQILIVPEPAGAGLVILAAGALLARRRAG
jgi:hypothetical protein